MTASEQLRVLMVQVARGEVDPESAAARIARFAVGLAMASEGKSVDGLTPLRLRLAEEEAHRDGGDIEQLVAHALNPLALVRRVRKLAGLVEEREHRAALRVLRPALAHAIDQEHDAAGRTERALAGEKGGARG